MYMILISLSRVKSKNWSLKGNRKNCKNCIKKKQLIEKKIIYLFISIVLKVVQQRYHFKFFILFFEF